MNKETKAVMVTETDRFEAVMSKVENHQCSPKGMSWAQLVMAITTIIAFILLGVLYIIRSENEPIKIDIENIKLDVIEIKEACKPIKSEDELAYFVDGRIGHYHENHPRIIKGE